MPPPSSTPAPSDALLGKSSLPHLSSASPACFAARLGGEEVVASGDVEVPVFHFPGSEETILVPDNLEAIAPQSIDKKNKAQTPLPTEEKKSKKGEKAPGTDEKQGIQRSMWKEVRRDLFEYEFTGKRLSEKWWTGGVDAKTGLVLLFSHELILVIPPESTGQAYFELNTDPCPEWMYGLTSNPPLIISQGHCCLITQSGSLVHFRIEPGPFSSAVISLGKSLAYTLAVDEQEERIVVAIVGGEIQARKFAALGEAELLFMTDIGVESLVCTGSHIFLASRSHYVHIYAAGDEGWVHSFTIGDGKRGCIDAMPPRLSHPVVFLGPRSNAAYLQSDNGLYTINDSGVMTWECKISQEEFFLLNDHGSPDPYACNVFGVHQQRIFRIIQQGYFDPYLVRYLRFGPAPKRRPLSNLAWENTYSYDWLS